jgi:hypothetical protein
MGSPREDHLSVLLNDGRILVAGGENNTASGDILLRSADIFDPLSSSFTPLTPLVEPRDDSTATLLRSGGVLIVGGEDDRAWGLPSAEIWEPCAQPEPLAGPVGPTLKLRRVGGRILLEWAPAADAVAYRIHRGWRAGQFETVPWRISLEESSWMVADDGASAFIRVSSVNRCGTPTE